jgi:hypothetical protein
MGHSPQDLEFTRVCGRIALATPGEPAAQMPLNASTETALIPISSTVTVQI